MIRFFNPDFEITLPQVKLFHTRIVHIRASKYTTRYKTANFGTARFVEIDQAVEARQRSK